MSDYTPATEEVEGIWEERTGDTADFRTWLANVKAEAWEQGRASVTFGVRPGHNAEIRIRPALNPYRETETT